MNKVTVIRLNYDCFMDESGVRCTWERLYTLRKAGVVVHVVDATDAEQGEWDLEPLN